MKKLIAILVSLMLAMAGISALAEAAGNDVYTVKTGVSYNDTWGITVANVIYKNGNVLKILLDTVRPDGGLSSKEKFDDYGIRPVSTLGKEWWEEIAFFETWAENNSLDTLELDENGHASNPDVISGATISLSYYADAIRNAESGTAETDGYTVKTGSSFDSTWGITVANVIYKNGSVFKVLLDTVRPDGGLSSKEKFNDYGIAKVSTLGKDWWEQVTFLETWLESNGADALQVTEDGYAVDADVLSGATIHVSYYAEALQDALKK